MPPDTDRHVLRDYPITYMPYVNMQMLLGHHLGLKGKVEQLLSEKDTKALQLKEPLTRSFMLRSKRKLLRLTACIVSSQRNPKEMI